METAIVIVNYKTPWHLNECLKSIFKYTTDFHIFVVQNAPDQKSLEVVRKFKSLYPALITEIVNQKNLGLVGGVNSAYDKAIKYERVCFLNSDIIVTKNWLVELNIALDGDDVVQVAPDLNHYYQEGVLWRFFRHTLAKRFPILGNKLYKMLIYFNPPRSSDQSGFRASTTFYHFCTGACNVLKTKYFIERGYFWDPNIIHGYGDDFDTTYYLRQFGKIGVTNKSYVFHFLNVSFNKLNDERMENKKMLQFWNQMYVTSKWAKRMEKDLEQYSLEERARLAIDSNEVRNLYLYLGLNTIPEFVEKLKTLPAIEYGKKLGIEVK